MAFVQRLIETTITLGPNPISGAARTFKESGTDTATFSGLRTSARITKVSAPGSNHLDLQIWGMTLSQMMQVHTLGHVAPGLTGPTFVTLAAGDEVNGMSGVYSGTVMRAWIDATNMPDVSLRIDSSGAGIESVTPITPTSIQGAVDLAQVMKIIATKLGVPFENSGVSVMVRNPYFHGDGWTQAKECAAAGDFMLSLDDGTVAIWPKGGARQALTPQLTPDNYIGYPTFTPTGLYVTTLFDPRILHGGMINISGSELEPANGDWPVMMLDHNLDSMVPRGRWFSNLNCAVPGMLVQGNP